MDLRAAALGLDTLPLVGQASRLRRARFLGRSLRYVTTPEGEVRVREQPCAVGPRLLFGVDGPNVVEHYDALLQALAGKADVVIFEPPGTGGSAPRRGFDFTLSSFAAVAMHLLEALGPRTLVFPCYLGLVAQLVARRAPELAPRVVLPQTVASDDLQRWADRVDRRRLLRTPVLGQALVASRRRTLARGWYGASVGHQEQRAPLAAISDRALRRGGCFCLASLMQALTAEAEAAVLADRGALPVPATVVWGAKDRTHARSDPARTLPGARVVRFEEAGHSPELEEPERFARSLLGWHEESP